jgi:hypothetical protein
MLSNFQISLEIISNHRLGLEKTFKKFFYFNDLKETIIPCTGIVPMNKKATKKLNALAKLIL